MFGQIYAGKRVLVTGHARRDITQLAARTDNNRVVNFAGPATLINHYAEVLITTAFPHSLAGELLPNELTQVSATTA